MNLAPFFGDPILDVGTDLWNYLNGIGLNSSSF